MGKPGFRLRLLRPGSASNEAVGPVDAVVAFWVLADAPDVNTVVRSAAGTLRQGGQLLLVEPDIPADESALARAVEYACRIGMRLVGQPRVALSRAALHVRE
jgi:hypothetical protein